MFFKKNSIIACTLLVVIIMFSFYSEYYASKFIGNVKEGYEDDVPTCSDSSVPKCSYTWGEEEEEPYAEFPWESMMFKSACVAPSPTVCPTVIHGHDHDTEESYESNSSVEETTTTTQSSSSSDSTTDSTTDSTSDSTPGYDPSLGAEYSETESGNANSDSNADSTQSEAFINTQAQNIEIQQLKNEIRLLKEQGANTNTGGNGSGSDKGCPPCPPCDRCPEPIFTCEKTINYRSPNVGQHLPLPILNDFSRFDDQ